MAVYILEGRTTDERAGMLALILRDYAQHRWPGNWEEQLGRLMSAEDPTREIKNLALQPLPAA